MTSKYFDTFAGLVAVKPLRINERGLVECRVTARTNRVYQTGEIITTTPRNIVYKTGSRGYGRSWITSVPDAELFA